MTLKLSVNSSLLCSILVPSVSPAIIIKHQGLDVQFKLLLDLGIDSKFTLRGGDIVDTVVEGATHGGRLRGQRNIERLDAHDLDEQLPVGFTGPFLGSEFLDLSRILVLSSGSASAIAKWHGD